MSSTVLSVTNLRKVFTAGKKHTVAVSGLSFSINEGEIVGLLGPNGAGKTTTIQLLLGATTKTSGEIVYFGKNVDQHRSEVLEQVNYASAYTKLPWQLTVMENLLVYAMMYNVSEPKKRIMKMLEQFGMADYAQKHTGSLSAGQMTRVILAKSFLNYPKIILLDEPTASLDPESASVVRTFLTEQQQRYKVAMLFTSHNMAEVTEMCDRVIFIQHGKIVAEDTPTGLAQTVTKSKIHLTMHALAAEHQKKMEKLFEEVHFDDLHMTLTVQEHEIASALQSVTNAGLVYDAISIDKPSLEDYFIAKSREKRL